MSFLIGSLSFVLLAVSLFMILLVLIQRGRGGGLAGAFGGMGGQSAFGTRAGDTFTRITIVLAVIWVLLAGGIGMLMRRDALADRTGANSAFTGGKDAETKKDDDGASDLGADTPDSEGNSGAPAATTPEPSADKKSEEAATVTPGSAELGKANPDAKSTTPADAPSEDVPASSSEPKAEEPKSGGEKSASEPAEKSEAPAEPATTPATTPETPASGEQNP